MFYDLNPGDKVGLVSPSRFVTKEDIARGVAYLQSLGFEVITAPHAFDKFRFMAGTAEARAEDLMMMYQDKSIKAIFATSGGDGAQYLPPLLDWKIIAKNPKPLVGLSDTTALQNAIYTKTKQVIFTGLTLNYDFRSGTLDKCLDKSVKTVLFGNAFAYKSGKALVEGKANGILVGGCLSLLRNLCGTEFFPDLSGKILLIEDVEEPTYKIDLMLQQISQCKGFTKLNGIIFGKFLDCTIRRKEDGNVNEVIKFFCQGFDIPVIYDFDYGHNFKRYMLPLGAIVEMESTAKCVVKAEG